MNSIPRWLSITIATLLVLLIIVIGVNQGLAAWSRTSQAPNGRTITITAEGKVTATPDTAVVDASIVGNDTTQQKAQSDIDQNAAKLVAFLQSSGIDKSDISTSGYNLYPQYDNTGKAPNTITGYSASETLTVKIKDISKVSDIIGGLTQNGSNQIQNVSYTINDPDALREQARQQALQSAGQKAADLASAAHVKLGKLITFSEQGDSVPPIYPQAMAVGSANGAMADKATLPAGSQDITEDVSVTYELK